eukprot:COSAG02_NODE_10825_length_1850_cov_1.796117_2_plen_108_part_00
MGPPGLVGVAAAMVARVEDRGGSSGYTLRGPIPRLVVQARPFTLGELPRLPWVVGLRGVALDVVLALVEVARSSGQGGGRPRSRAMPLAVPVRFFGSDDGGNSWSSL